MFFFDLANKQSFFKFPKIILCGSRKCPYPPYKAKYEA